MTATLLQLGSGYCCCPCRMSTELGVLSFTRAGLLLTLGGWRCHRADVPSFVTGDSLVVFDPHTSYIPGATVNQPGIRIRFAAQDKGRPSSQRSLAAQFPDQVTAVAACRCLLHPLSSL